MSERINRIFTKIARRYDLMNHLFSMGVDFSWRKRAAEMALMDRQSYRVLDVAAGTGDLTMMIERMCNRRGKDVKVVGADFNAEMLEVAREKAERAVRALCSRRTTRQG